MESYFAEEIKSLEQRLKELNFLLMETSKGMKERNRIEAEIRAVTFQLSHYRTMLANEQPDSNH